MPGCEIGDTSMDQVLTYSSHHYWLTTFAAVTGLAVLLYELYLRTQSVGAIAPQEAIRLMNQGATLLDLRPREAYAAGHINGARQFDTSQILNGAETLKRYKEKPLIVCSDNSSLAASAVRTLTRQGFTKVFNLRGGVAAWRAENLPLARE
jgi:rhodanese-related sulfurtransferase